ncbi:hypothetical protein CK203_107133 [Vitis vinifera]|uniref:Retrotransposon gag domain-containing protein n=1 Tax=Vitis vinifera TaxID=29760 RepID=A0A438CVN8_VITVI|nr:hypothetical protein CK203_107133 [Vitis vinifera]
MEATPEDQHSHQGHQNNLNEFISMRDRMHPPCMSAPSCIVPPYRAASDQTRILPLLPTFHRMETKENEKFYECWERYMEAINACLTMALIRGYESGGSYGFLSYVAEVSRGWMNHKGEVGKMKSQPSAFNAKAGMYTLKEDDDMKAKFAAMTRRLEELELKKCMKYKLLLKHQCKESRAPQYQQLAQPSQQSSSLEQAIGISARMDGMQNDYPKDDNLQYSISRLTNLNTVQEKGDFLLNPPKPQGFHEVETMRGIFQILLEVQRSGCPTISVMIGEKVVEKALLDLGASVNLLPYSVYKQLGLGELKPTTITLSLVDRSVKIPRGEANSVPIILGRPFLATSNAIINCRNGLMQLTFGNMTLELNFHMSKKQTTPEEEEVQKRLSEPPDVLATLQSWRRKRDSTFVQ